MKAALTGSNSGISTTFTLGTNVQIASLTKVSGDSQSAQAGKAFGAPLVVQVMGTNGQPVVNQPVSFTVTGGATLSANSALTDATGKAQITVTAGATPGAVTVNAFVGSVSQTFNLTISPPGPSLSTSSFYNAGGGVRLSALSPCSLVTVIASGLAPNVQGLVLNSNGFGPWATTLANDSISVGGVASPIYSVGNVGGVEQITFQVPCETGDCRQCTDHRQCRRRYGHGQPSGSGRHAGHLRNRHVRRHSPRGDHPSGRLVRQPAEPGTPR